MIPVECWCGFTDQADALPAAAEVAFRHAVTHEDVEPEPVAEPDVLDMTNWRPGEVGGLDERPLLEPAFLIWNGQRVEIE